MPFKQAAHPLLMIPGSIEVSDAVLEANAVSSLSHTHQPFIGIFQSALKNLRKIFKSEDPDSQPMVLAGSGTLGWDIVGSNFVEPKDDVLFLSTGFFSDRFVDCLKVYGTNVDVLPAKVGEAVPFEDIEAKLKSKKYKMIGITQVDTSTAVLTDVGKVCELVKKLSPETLIVVDGVCSIAVEDFEFDKWGVDFALTASQKAIGIPPGLSISYLSKRAVDVALARNPTTYYTALKRWIPIMKAYESGKAAYLGTPPVQLINALDVSLKEILADGLEARFAKHRENAAWFHSEIGKLGLKMVPNPAVKSNALSAIYFPEGVTGADFLPLVAKENIVFAGGIHPSCAQKYFRVGHMGVSVVKRKDTELALNAIKSALKVLQKI